MLTADNPPPEAGAGDPPPGTGPAAGGSGATDSNGGGICQLQPNAKPQNGVGLVIILLLGLLWLQLRSNQKAF